MLSGTAPTFLTVSAPSSIQEFQTKSMYDYQKDKLKKEWPGHMVRFDYIHAGGRGVAYTPYLTYGLDQALGTTIKKEGYSKLPDQLKTFEITSIAIPCLVFSLEELTEKLRRYAPQFNIKQVVGLTATGGPTSVETDHTSIGAILEKK
ncbi:MAG: hypothetical protein WCN27_06440 [Alphaproteobacteria bacterium]